MPPFFGCPNCRHCCPTGTDLAEGMVYRGAIAVSKRVGLMKKILLAGTALLSVLSSAALAADMRPAARAPIYTKAPMMAPAYSWTGCYIGGNVGGLWAKKDWSITGTGVGQSSVSINSGLGGGQVGCNYQVSTWVFGIQGDYDWTNANGTAADASFGGAVTDQTNIKSLASVTGRVGYTWDRFMLYGKGGGAWVKDNYTASFGGLVSTASETRTGWTAGAGIEYAFTDWLTGFAEYDYYGFGTKSVTFAAFPIASSDIKQTISVAKAGINFKFNPFGGRY
jgi:outer membrane immunogenic protein